MIYNILWKNILLALSYWIIALAITVPVVYLAECISPWFWMLMIITIPVLLVLTIIFSEISHKIEEE